jgi:hypothetical protein
VLATWHTSPGSVEIRLAAAVNMVPPAAAEVVDHLQDGRDKAPGTAALAVAPKPESGSGPNATLRALLDFGRRELSLPTISLARKEAVQ